MDTDIKTTNIELTPSIAAYIEDKIGGLEKYLKRVGSPHVVHVEAGKNTKHHRHGPVMFCHAHLSIPGATLHAKAEANDLYAAIDLAREELERQIVRYKEKKKRI
ncbi:ribosome-associated translation inhibitor RaiA [Patescibacteria group bacterium]|nr:MAG: ribosome-associated translation inhibitor RaiA [Patescibacteria group bacterium]